MTRTLLMCRACGYDATQTVGDGFAVCPECGGGVSEELCARNEENLPRQLRRELYISWAAPLVAAAAGLATESRQLFWWGLLLSAGLIYWRWWLVENWIDRRGAWHRALKHTLAILIFYFLFVFGPAITLAFEVFDD